MPWATLSATVRGSCPAPSVEMTVILSTAASGSAALATTCGSTSTSIWSTAASPYLREGVGLLLHGLGLRRALGGDRGRLRLTLEAYGIGERRALCLLALTGEPGPLGVRLRLLDQGDTAGLGLLLGLVAGGVGGLADLGVQLTVGQRGLARGDLLLLAEDLLPAGGLGERAGRVGAGGRLVRLGLDLGLLQGEGPLRDGDLLLRLQPGLLGGAPGDGLGDVRLLLGAGGLGPARGPPDRSPRW